ncbi:hypothetical protein E4G67_00870 [Candidatus Bathyarchaeota archaeon]|nr:MAG: hypothetical protein E4G67_00870 [Candidatus Bathyarchaeota archaeon]
MQFAVKFYAPRCARVLNKIIAAKPKEKQDLPIKTNIACFSIGFALIHPPSSINLPNTLIVAFHIDKKSTFGAEYALMIYFKLDTPAGPSMYPLR